MKTINIFLSVLALLLTTGVQAQVVDCETDNVPPIAICLSNLMVSIPMGQTLELWPDDFNESSNDNCSEVSLTFLVDGAEVENMTITEDTPSPSTIVLNVTDASGNQSSCWGQLTINDQICLDDLEPPVAICDEHLVVMLDANNMATIFAESLDDGSYDNCSAVTLAFSEDGTSTSMQVDETTASPFDAILYVTDAAGLQNSCFVNIEIKEQPDCDNDTTAPTPYCISGLTVVLGENSSITLEASDLDAGSFDDCSSNVQMAFSEDITDQTLTLTAVGTYNLTMWANDSNGNQDFCETFVVVEPFGSQQSISGNVRTEIGASMSGVVVQAIGSNNQVASEATTDASGNYQLADLPAGTYEISVIKDDAHLNGVSTFDIVMVARHILGITELPSPFRMLAADVNGSNTVTTFDMVITRRIILAYQEAYDNVPSWRFFRSTIQFADPSNPWNGGITGNSSTITVGTNPVNAVDFIGIKMGDVNGSAVPD